MAANYDNTTWFYERLSKLVFGQAQIQAQEYFLDQIQPGASILIIGGGTGQILESLARLHPSGIQITYVEVSAKMMALSRKRHTGKNTMKYITAAIGETAFTNSFDVVITAFLFDNFSQESLEHTFPLIDAQVESGALWLNTDFRLTGPLWQKLMLKTMYLFFSLFKAVDVQKPPNVEPVFGQYGYQNKQQKSFYRNFIISQLYVKA